MRKSGTKSSAYSTGLAGKSKSSKRRKIGSRRFYRSDVESLERQLTVFKEKRLSRTVAIDIPEPGEVHFDETTFDENAEGIEVESREVKSAGVLGEEELENKRRMTRMMSIRDLKLNRCYSEEWD